MNSSTCQVLAAIFPVILLTVVLESRNVNVGIRRLRIFPWLSMAVVGSSLIGVFISVIGVATNGLGRASAPVVWVAFGVDLLCLGTLVLMLIVTREIDEEKESSASD